MVSVRTTKAGTITAELLGVDKTRQATTSARKNLQAYGKSVEKLGKTLTANLTLPLVGFGTGAVATARKFERSFASIEAFVGRSKSEVNAMRAATEKLAASTGVGPNQLAEGFYTVSSAGYSGSEAIDVMTAAARASAAGMGDTRTVAESLTRAVAAYAGEGLQAAEATDLLAKTVQQGNFRAEDLAGVLGRVVPVAASVGVELDDVGGALAVLSRQMEIDEAATRLTAALSKIVKPSKMAVNELARVGLTVDEVRAMIDEDLIGAFRHLENSGADLGKVFEDVRGLSGVLALLQADAAEVDHVFGELDKSAGMVDEAFNKMSQTSDAKMSAALATMHTQLIEIGADLLPMVASAFQKVAAATGRAVEIWSNLDETTQQLIIGVAAVAAAAGPALVAVGKLTQAFAALRVAMTVVAAHPVALAIGAIATVVGGAFVAAHIHAANRTAALKDRITELQSELSTLQPKIDALPPSLDKSHTSAKKLSDELSVLSAELNEASEAADNAQSNLGKIWGGLKDAAGAVVKATRIGDAWGWLTDNPELDRQEAKIREIEEAMVDVRSSVEQATIAKERNRQAVEYWENSVFGATSAQDNLAAAVENTSMSLRDQAHATRDALEQLLAYGLTSGHVGGSDVLGGGAFGGSLSRAKKDYADLMGIINGIDSALEHVAGSSRRYTRDTTANTKAVGANTKQVKEQYRALRILQKGFSVYSRVLNEARRAVDNIFASEKSRMKARLDAYDKLARLEDRLNEPKKRQSEVKKELDKATARYAQLQEMHERQGGVHTIEQREEFAALGERIDELTGEYDSLADQIEANVGEFNLLTQAGRDNQRAAMDAAEGIREYELSLVAAGISADQAAQMADVHRQELIRQLEAAGLNDTKINELINTYSRVPAEVATAMIVDRSEAMAEIANWRAELAAIPEFETTLAQLLTSGALAAIDQLKSALDEIPRNINTVHNIQTNPTGPGSTGGSGGGGSGGGGGGSSSVPLPPSRPRPTPVPVPAPSGGGGGGGMSIIERNRKAALEERLRLGREREAARREAAKRKAAEEARRKALLERQREAARRAAEEAERASQFGRQELWSAQQGGTRKQAGSVPAPAPSRGPWQSGQFGGPHFSSGSNHPLTRNGASSVTNVNVNVGGSVISEFDLVDRIREQLHSGDRAGDGSRIALSAI